jgi:hypothetical protein
MQRLPIHQEERFTGRLRPIAKLMRVPRRLPRNDAFNEQLPGKVAAMMPTYRE